MDIITCYIPGYSGNQYSENIKRCLKKAGYHTVSFKRLVRSPGLFLRCRIFNFNWYENIDEQKNIWIQTGMKYMLVWILKLCRKKIVYTVHNRMPHNSAGPAHGTAVMKFMMKHADAVTGLCSETAKAVDEIYAGALEKLYIIPHPNYIRNYRLADEKEIQKKREQYGFRKTDFVCLMLGFVSPYKNIELLAEAADRLKQTNIRLLIAGCTESDIYKKVLLSKLEQNKKISVDFRYIPDSEISSFYGAADIAVLPYKMESVLNSGAVYLSFSLARTVICPDIPTIQDIADKSFLYTYHYSSDEEHLDRLTEALSDAYRDFITDRAAFREKGKRAFAYAERFHSMEKITQMYQELYRELLSCYKA